MKKAKIYIPNKSAMLSDLGPEGRRFESCHSDHYL